MKTLLALDLTMTIAFLALFTFRVVKEINFDRNCTGYLKRSADANNAVMAKKQLDVAVSYLQENHLTNGYTSIIYRTPDEDISFFYDNLIVCQKELGRLLDKTDRTQLEESNMLMKLRETLLDDGEHGTTVTVPDGISVYPNNALLSLPMFISLIGAVFAYIGFCLILLTKQ